MNAKLSQPVFKWLYHSGIKVSHTYLDHQLQSHPDYPSLASITDTLDELGIENMSLVVDKEKLDELPVPFLAHSPLNGGGFMVVNNIEEQIRQDKEFEKNWDGIVVLAEKPTGWHHTENENALTKDKTIRQQTIFGIAAIGLLAAFFLFNHFSFSLAGLLFASIAGLSIAILIIQQKLGISNEIIEQLCSASKETDCNAVINSKGSKLGIWMNWADAGIIYFTSFLLLLIISAASSLLFLLASAAIPFIFFSVYYQWRVVKKWCILCLLTVVVLVMQFALLMPVALSLAKGGLEGFPGDTLFFAAFVFTTIAAAWLLVIKPALQKNKELIDKNYSLLRFKNNPDVFNALLQQQRRVDTTPFENDLQLGNPDAPLQIIVACNPYCGPCAKTHETLNELVEKNDIGLTIRFSLKAENKEDKKTQTVEYLLQLLTDETNVYKRKVMHDWYENMGMKTFRLQYPLQNKKNVDVLLRLQDRWSDKVKIAFTPTIFINGYELPKQYRANDIKNLIRSAGKWEKQLNLT